MDFNDQLDIALENSSNNINENNILDLYNKQNALLEAVFKAEDLEKQYRYQGYTEAQIQQFHEDWKAQVKDKWDAIKEESNGVVGTIKGWVQRVIAWLKSFFTKAANAVENDDEFIKKYRSDLLSAGNSLDDVEINMPKRGSLPELKIGDITFRRKAAMVGAATAAVASVIVPMVMLNNNSYQEKSLASASNIDKAVGQKGSYNPKTSLASVRNADKQAAAGRDLARAKTGAARYGSADSLNNSHNRDNIGYKYNPDKHDIMNNYTNTTRGYVNASYQYQDNDINYIKEDSTTSAVAAGAGGLLAATGILWLGSPDLDKKLAEAKNLNNIHNKKPTEEMKEAVEDEVK